MVISNSRGAEAEEGWGDVERGSERERGFIRKQFCFGGVWGECLRRKGDRERVGLFCFCRPIYTKYFAFSVPGSQDRQTDRPRGGTPRSDDRGKGCSKWRRRRRRRRRRRKVYSKLTQ